jgi:DNA polymerase III alpha subunit
MSKVVDYNCPKTWELFKEGKTKGVFQLESNLGRSWSKKVSPCNMEELSALIALIRPGCLKAISNGKSMTQHYVDRKHGIDEVEYLHESLESILGNTYGVLVYQEQSMMIAQQIAGFNLQEADILRKAIGKKKAGLMAKVKKSFIKGAEKEGIVNAEEAEEIFSWIEKSSRYAFNKSHSVAYAMNSYTSAWYKANHVKEFFLAYFYHAIDKQDPHQEIYELVSEAKLFDLQLKTPSIKTHYPKFHEYKNGIMFGVKDIKSLTGKTGDKVICAIKDLKEECGKEISEVSWVEILLGLSQKISSTAFKALASVGFFRGFDGSITRNRAIYEYEIFRSLSKGETSWVIENYPNKKWKSLVDCFVDLSPAKKNGGGTSRVDRSQAVQNEIHFLQNPPYDMDDDPSWVIAQEVKFLGCPVSLSKIEASDTSSANTTCKEVVDGKKGKGLCVAGNINRVSNYKVKKGESKGKYMSFLTIEDETCSLDSVIVFPKTRDKYQYVLYEGNNLVFCGSISDKDDSFIVNKIYEI